MTEPICTTDAAGRKEWRLDGLLHREDGPAIECPDLGQFWYLRGIPHREDGPAVERIDGTKIWYIHGKIYSEEEFHAKYPKKFVQDGIYGDFTMWTLNGEYHREFGPAVIYSCGTKEWWVDGKLHRRDGPAVEDVDGIQKWYVHGKLHRTDGPAVKYADGSNLWYLHGEYHREDGPAITYVNGPKEWWSHGKRHRIGGPAIEDADGTVGWWVDGKELTEEEYKEKYPIRRVDPHGVVRWTLKSRLHREDGPAVEWPSSTKEWWSHGKRHRDGKPAVVFHNGDEEWWVNGERHRDGGPAILYISGKYRVWCQHGQRHRLDGPAIEDVPAGLTQWYINGEILSEEEFLKRTSTPLKGGIPVDDISCVVAEKISNPCGEIASPNDPFALHLEQNRQRIAQALGLPETATAQTSEGDIAFDIEAQGLVEDPPDRTRTKPRRLSKAKLPDFTSNVIQTETYINAENVKAVITAIAKKYGMVHKTLPEVQPELPTTPTTKTSSLELLQGKAMLDVLASSLLLPLGDRTAKNLLPYMKILLPIILEHYFRDRNPKLARLSEQALEAQLLASGLRIKDEVFAHFKRSTQGQVTEAFQGYIDLAESEIHELPPATEASELLTPSRMIQHSRETP